MLAELLVLIYTSSMLFKHSLQILFVTTLITIPLTASVKQKNESSIDFDFSYTTQINDNQTNIYEVKRSKDNTDETEKKLSKRQKELMKKREKALAEIEARKAEAERLEQEALEEQARLEKEAQEAKEKAEREELEAKEKAEKEALEAKAQEELEAKKLEEQKLLEEKEAEEKRRKEEELAAAEAQKAAELAAAEAQKKEQEMLQAQIEKELEKQKSASEKNKKEYLSDYMVYDVESINDSEDNEILFQIIPNPDERDASGKTLLMRAAKEGNEWELKQLLDSHANVNLKDSDGWTALMYAVRYSGSLECVEKLLEAGADVSEKNTYGFSALVLAACYNGNPQILNKLLDSYKASDKEVLRALVFLLSEQNISERQQLSKLQIFMDKAVPLNILYEGKTPLMYAAQYGNSTKVLQILLDNQSSVTMRSTEGKTAFDYAIKNNNLAHNETYWALNKK